jgi:hypothetical protein
MHIYIYQLIYRLMLNHWITMGFKSPGDYQTRQGAMSLVGARDLLGELVLKKICSISGPN